MARPTKTPSEQLTYRGNFRLTEAEGKQLEEDAANAGKTVSDYMRGLALNTKPRSRKATPERKEKIVGLGQLGNIRADINVLAKDRLAHRFVDPEQIKRALNALESAAISIVNDLER